MLQPTFKYTLGSKSILQRHTANNRMVTNVGGGVKQKISITFLELFLKFVLLIYSIPQFFSVVILLQHATEVPNFFDKGFKRAFA